MEGELQRENEAGLVVVQMVQGPVFRLIRADRFLIGPTIHRMM